MPKNEAKPVIFASSCDDNAMNNCDKHYYENDLIWWDILTKDKSELVAFFESSVTLVFRSFAHFDNLISATIENWQRVFPKIRILIISDTVIYPPLKYSKKLIQANVKMITLENAPGKTPMHPSNFIHTPFVLFVPDSVGSGGNAHGAIDLLKTFVQSKIIAKFRNKSLQNIPTDWPHHIFFNQTIENDPFIEQNVVAAIGQIIQSDGKLACNSADAIFDFRRWTFVTYPRTSITFDANVQNVRSKAALSMQDSAVFKKVTNAWVESDLCRKRLQLNTIDLQPYHQRENTICSMLDREHSDGSPSIFRNFYIEQVDVCSHVACHEGIVPYDELLFLTHVRDLRRFDWLKRPVSKSLLGEVALRGWKLAFASMSQFPLLTLNSAFEPLFADSHKMEKYLQEQKLLHSAFLQRFGIKHIISLSVRPPEVDGANDALMLMAALSEQPGSSRKKMNKFPSITFQPAFLNGPIDQLDIGPFGKQQREQNEGAHLIQALYSQLSPLEKLNLHNANLNLEKTAVHNYGCHAQTKRCFGTVLDDTPMYIWEGRWTPPCCLQGLRKVGQYVFNKLKAQNVRYWLEGGSLLGAIRHADIIPWDYDLDIGIHQSDINKSPEILELSKLSKGEGRTFDGFYWENAREGQFYRVHLSKSNHLHLDIFPFYERENDGEIIMTKNTWIKSHRQDMEFPASFLNPLIEIDFIGMKVSSPNHPIQFLEFKFGKGVVEEPRYPGPTVDTSNAIVE